MKEHTKKVFKYLHTFFSLFVIYTLGFLTPFTEPSMIMIIISFFIILYYTEMIEHTFKMLDHYQKTSERYFSWFKEDENKIKVLREKLSEK